jgi:hypothetical protein
MAKSGELFLETFSLHHRKGKIILLTFCIKSITGNFIFKKHKQILGKKTKMLNVARGKYGREYWGKESVFGYT